MKSRVAGRVLTLAMMLVIDFVAAAAAPAAPTDQELQKFVAASVAVHSINETSQVEQQKAKTPEEASKIEDAAGLKMEKAVTAKGLTTERFTQIFEVMQDDPKVRARVTELAKQQTGK